jgi:putative flippase GtrA
MTRLGRFAGVGLLGWIVQLIVLSALLAAGVHYMVATALAVELTILHNFAWHEFYTWRDARSPSVAAAANRLLRFNASTAVVSVLGNVTLTALAVEYLHSPAATANALAVSILGVFNYTAARHWIFRPRQ